MCPLSNEDLRQVVIQSCTVVQPVLHFRNCITWSLQMRVLQMWSLVFFSFAQCLSRGICPELT